MQTHKFIWKLFEVKYSTVKTWELEWEKRLDSDFYDYEFLNLEIRLNKKKYEYLGDLSEKIFRNPMMYGFEYSNNWIPFIIIDDLNNPYIELSNCKFISEDINDRFKSTQLKKYDLVMWVRGTIWRFGLYLWDNFKANISPNNIFFRLKDKSIYVCAYLISNYWQLFINRITAGTGQPTITSDLIKNIKIPIPSTDFQQKIEELVVKSYEEKEKSESLYKEVEKILLQELNLLDFQPSTKEFNLFHQLFTIENNSSIIKYSDLTDKDRLDAEYWDNRYLEIENRIKEYDWWYDTITNLSILSKDKIQLQDDYSYNYIELADINKSTWLVENTTEIIWKELPSRARMKIEKWDVLMSSLEGSIDKVAIVDFEKDNLVASTGFYIFREWFLNKETLLILLKFLWGRYIVREALGTIMSAISNSWLENILLPKVDKGIQDTIALKIQESFIAKEQSKKLLEVAKRGVEVYIEETEEKGLEYIESNI